MTKKTHILYSIISICAIIAYCGFLVKNSISDVDTVEETLPYNYDFDADIPEEITEPVAREAAKIKPDVPRTTKIAPPEEASDNPTEAKPEITDFSPMLPVNGNISKGFSLSHTYNEDTLDWRTHCGIDITSSPADAVFACEDGSVTASYEDPLWGNVIEIDHGEYISVYKNLSTLIMVKIGDSVTRGEKISGVGQGCAGEAGAAHIHFELLHYGEYVDPSILIS